MAYCVVVFIIKSAFNMKIFGQDGNKRWYEEVVAYSIEFVYTYSVMVVIWTLFFFMDKVTYSDLFKKFMFLWFETN